MFKNCLNCFKFIIINQNHNIIEQKIRKCLKTAKIALNSLSKCNQMLIRNDFN